jgi:P4 family phage/plasmid primase-like protien
MSAAQLDFAKLDNPKQRANGDTEAACPACREMGGDKTGNHLLVKADGRFGCVAYPNDGDHRKRIFALIGTKSSETPRAASTQTPAPRTWPTLERAAKACEPSGYTLAKCWTYADGKREVLAVARYENATGKTFRQFQQKAGAWTTGAPSGKLPLLGKDQLPTSGPVVVVEGEKCFDAAQAIGLPVVCAACGASAAAKTDWQPIAGRDVWIFPDNNEPGEKFAQAVKTILRKLNPATTIRLARLPGLPEGGDIVDWIAANRGSKSDAELRDEVEDIATAAPVEDCNDILPDEQGDRRQETSPENGKLGGRPNAPSPIETAQSFMRETLMDGEVVTVRHYRDQWFAYSPGAGWAVVTDGEMLKRLMTWLQSKGDQFARHATANYARNVMVNLSAFGLCGIPAQLERPCWLSTGKDARNVMAFSNGLAVDVMQFAEALAAGGELPEGCIRPVTADLFSSDFVGYSFEAEAGRPERFVKYLKRVCPDPDTYKCVVRMMGMMMADTARFEVFFQLYGKGANGKTVLLDIIEALVGRQNVSQVALEFLAPGTRFQSFPLVTAKANISGELRTDTGGATLAAIEGQFKHAVSGGKIEVERKGVDKTFERCRARFVMSANSLPTFVDRSDAIWRRLRILPFEVEIPDDEKDIHLARKIIESEMPQIARLALDGLAEIIMQGRFPDCKRGAEIKQAHRATCDHEREFLVETYEPASRDDRVSAASIYEDYKTWMKNNGYWAQGAAKFKARVEDVFTTAKYGVFRVEGDVVKGVAGIRRRFVTDVTSPNSPYDKPKQIGFSYGNIDSGNKGNILAVEEVLP